MDGSKFFWSYIADDDQQGLIGPTRFSGWNERCVIPSEILAQQGCS
jgi:hypothetical protein